VDDYNSERKSKKQRKAGLRAGAVAGFFFPSLIFFVTAVFSNYLQMFVRNQAALMARNGFPLSFNTVFLIFIVFGAIIVGFLTAALGATLGVVFVKIMGRLPFQSTYTNSILFAIVLTLVYSITESIRYLPRYVIFPFDFYNSVVFMIDGLIFAFLFNRWKKA